MEFTLEHAQSLQRERRRGRDIESQVKCGIPEGQRLPERGAHWQDGVGHAGFVGCLGHASERCGDEIDPDNPPTPLGKVDSVAPRTTPQIKRRGPDVRRGSTQGVKEPYDTARGTPTICGRDTVVGRVLGNPNLVLFVSGCH